MDTVYIALVRYGPEWDSQSIYRTKSKALFEQMRTADLAYGNTESCYFAGFSEELKAELRARYEQQKLELPEFTTEPLDEEMSLSEAMEWLDCYGEDYNKFPVVLAGETELTCRWNW